MDEFIELPYGGSGAGFYVSQLIEHIRSTGRDYIIQGGQNRTLKKHSKPHSLDFWLRVGFTQRKDTRQAVRQVIEALVATGKFEVDHSLCCPDSERLCKGIRLRRPAEVQRDANSYNATIIARTEEKHGAPINNCPYSFQQLVNESLPKHMERMRTALAKPLSMQRFARRGVGLKTILKELELENDLPGCYVFLDGDFPIYVGISRTVMQRLIRHVKGKTHYNASLAYKMASEGRNQNSTRDAAMKEPAFKEKFEGAKRYLSSCQVAITRIENDLELHLFEVYCAMELNTSKWNTFRTH